MPEVIVRRAAEADLPALGRMGAELMRLHFTFDPLRFMNPGSDPESGYSWFLGTQIHDDDAAIFVAERAGVAVGYVYAALEPQSWKELREASGFVHDVVVREDARRAGVATALMEAAMAWLKSRGAPRVMLGTAEANHGAQALFARLGFRRTMVEMTKEL
jgi:ribosomal protein S18 acetylase RimI-like enzyme